MALAYFITFSTYGTWLHGNAKGSVDKKHNGYGTAWLESDAERENQVREAMTQTDYFMSAMERDIVCKAIVDLTQNRGWQVWAVQVRTNHVHIVVSGDRDPGRIMSDMKGRASRDLSRAGFDDNNRRRWTRHGSTRHLFREEEVEASICYTLDEQGERMACYEAPRHAKEPRTK
jgi:REP element-mobilizing transposase RayT